MKQKSCVEHRHSITCWNITRIFLFFTMKPKRSFEFLVFLCRDALPATIKFSPSSTLIMQGTASAVWSEVTKHQHVSTNFYFFCCAPPGRLLYSETFLLLSDVSKTLQNLNFLGKYKTSELGLPDICSFEFFEIMWLVTSK